MNYLNTRHLHNTLISFSFIGFSINNVLLRIPVTIAKVKTKLEAELCLINLSNYDSRLPLKVKIRSATSLAAPFPPVFSLHSQLFFYLFNRVWNASGKAYCIK